MVETLLPPMMPPSTVAARSPGAAIPGFSATSVRRRAKARSRISAARESLASCQLCLHRCEVSRLQGPAGKCHASSETRFFAAQTDVADELELIPSFAVSLSGCNLRCDFCITGESSWNARAGRRLNPGDISVVATKALSQGARHVMILGGEPTIHLPALLELISELPDQCSIILKTNACFTQPVRNSLEGLIDVWLPDLKFGNAACAQRLAAIPRALPSIDSDDPYVAIVTSNLLWMARTAANSHQLIVRHLLMPGHVRCCWSPIAHWLAHSMPKTKVSLRFGYWPAWHANRHPELRTLFPENERREALDIAAQLHLHLVP